MILAEKRGEKWPEQNHDFRLKVREKWYVQILIDVIIFAVISKASHRMNQSVFHTKSSLCFLLIKCYFFLAFTAEVFANISQYIPGSAREDAIRN